MTGAVFSLVLTVTGILLLLDPAAWSVAIIRIVGILFVVLGVLDLVKYFRTAPVIAAKGTAFCSGVTMITAGAFLVLGSGWFISAFPLLAMLYGLFQVLIGFRKLQKMTDSLRMKQPLWYLHALSAGLTLLFGFIVVFNPDIQTDYNKAYKMLSALYVKKKMTALEFEAWSRIASELRGRLVQAPSGGLDSV